MVEIKIKLDNLDYASIVKVAFPIIGKKQKMKQQPGQL